MLAVVATLGCARSAPPAADEAAPLPALTVDELDRALASGGAQAVDANSDAVRKKLGVIPGAVLLTDYDAYAASELPADKARPLVFYCANDACTASHDAAAKARLAGHTQVKVLPAGIGGWVAAGKRTQAL